MQDLENKVILVTGGASGIGAAIVRRAAAAGARVAVVGRDRSAVEAFASGVAQARGYEADVRSAESMEAACAAVVRDFGRLDGAVNNAGIGGVFASFADTALDNWQAVLDTNLTGVFNSTRAELARMLPTGGGSIVNMGSLSSLLAERHMAAYIASKHAVVGLTRATAIDHAREGIRCNAICPSFVKTPMTEAGIPDPAVWDVIAAQHPGGRLVTVDDVAEIAVFLLSDRSAGMTASVHLADAGVAAI